MTSVLLHVAQWWHHEHQHTLVCVASHFIHHYSHYALWHPSVMSDTDLLGTLYIALQQITAEKSG